MGASCRAAVCLGVLLVGASARADVFPLGRQWAGGASLPLPYAIGVTAYAQDQDYELERLSARSDAMDLGGLIAGANLQIENRLTEYHVEPDVWVFPFLDMFGILGYIDGKTEVETGLFGLGFDVNYEGLVYGGGATLVGGCEPLFASLTGTFTWTDLDTSSSTVRAWVLTPKIGVAGAGWSVYAGAMYQETEERHTGTVSVMGADVEYDVRLRQSDAWNYTLGTTIFAGPHWQFDLEGGFGDRQHGLATARWRF